MVGTGVWLLSKQDWKRPNIDTMPCLFCRKSSTITTTRLSHLLGLIVVDETPVICRSFSAANGMIENE